VDFRIPILDTKAKAQDALGRNNVTMAPNPEGGRGCVLYVSSRIPFLLEYEQDLLDLGFNKGLSCERFRQFWSSVKPADDATAANLEALYEEEAAALYNKRAKRLKEPVFGAT